MSMLFIEAEIAYRQEQVRQDWRRVGRSRRRHRQRPAQATAPQPRTALPRQRERANQAPAADEQVLDRPVAHSG